MMDKDTTSAIIHFTNILSVALVTVVLYKFHRIPWRLCPNSLKEKDFLDTSLAKARCLYADLLKQGKVFSFDFSLSTLLNSICAFWMLLLVDHVILVQMHHLSCGGWLFHTNYEVSLSSYCFFQYMHTHTHAHMHTHLCQFEPCCDF